MAAATVAALEGQWIAAQEVFPDGAFDPEMIERGCGFTAWEIAPEGVLGFTVTHIARGEPTAAVVRYTWVNAATFTRSSDPVGTLEMLYGPDWQEMSSEIWATAFLAPNLHGHAMVHVVGPDIAVIESVAAAPQILARCP